MSLSLNEIEDVVEDHFVSDPKFFHIEGTISYIYPEYNQATHYRIRKLLLSIKAKIFPNNTVLDYPALISFYTRKSVTKNALPDKMTFTKNLIT